MKKYSLFAAIALFAGLTFAGCSANTDDDHSLGRTPEVSSITFSSTPQTAFSANRIDFTNTSSVSGVPLWDFGNGSTAKGNTATSDFPFAGDYTVTMTLYTEGGSVSTTQTITVAADDFALLDTPNYRNLTGGPDDLDGKTWVFDQYHEGHFGVGPAGDPSVGPTWWSAPAMAKDETSLYTQKFTFIQRAVQFKWENNGHIYANQLGLDDMGVSVDEETPDGDFDVPYVPADDLTFLLNETDMTLKLSDGAFFGNYQGTSTYTIISLTETELYLYCQSSTDSNGWWYRLIPEELNIEPVVTVEVKAVPMMDDMEEEEVPFVYTAKDMGDDPKTKRGYDNPLPFGLNTSNKVYMYEKTTELYSNLMIPNQGYKFDLTEQNTIKMKVYFPSYNDYETEGEAAGDWINITHLQRAVAVKLQDSTKGENAWDGQAQVLLEDLPTDEWVELEFDFSDFADHQDYDQIIIQFGGEGHPMPGLFFFDDFSFE